MARRNDQQHVIPAGQQLPMRLQGQLLLRFVGAGGNPHGPPRSDGPAYFRAAFEHARFGAVMKLEVAGHPHVQAVRAEVGKAPCIPPALRPHAPHRLQCGGGEPAHAPVAGMGPLGQAGAGHHQRHARGPAGGVQPRPDLGFQDDAQGGARGAQEAPVHHAQIQRQKAMRLRFAQAAPDRCRPGRGEGGKQHGQVRPAGAQFAGQRRKRPGFTERRAVQPHAAGRHLRSPDGPALGQPAAPAGIARRARQHVAAHGGGRNPRQRPVRPKHHPVVHEHSVASISPLIAPFFRETHKYIPVACSGIPASNTPGRRGQ